jgi:AcrR family transcriptional regulator
MHKKDVVHRPKQKRSEDTQKKILAAAKKLFCCDGYYQTTTNNIAAEAGISVGNLYFYYPNKKTIFMNIISDYSKSFLEIHESFRFKFEQGKTDSESFLRSFTESVVKNHEREKELNREFLIVSCKDPDVASIARSMKKRTLESITDFLASADTLLRVTDIRQAAEVVYTFIDAVAHRILFYDLSEEDNERLISGSVEAVCMYLFK